MRSRKDLDDAISACDRTYIVRQRDRQGKNGSALFQLVIRISCWLSACICFLTACFFFDNGRCMFCPGSGTAVREA